MGRLYDYCARVQEHIEHTGLDVFKTRGAIALEAGFLITLVDPGDPDDEQKIAALKEASRKVLNLNLD
jgi:hypothetical protein